MALGVGWEQGEKVCGSYVDGWLRFELKSSLIEFATEQGVKVNVMCQTAPSIDLRVGNV